LLGQEFEVLVPERFREHHLQHRMGFIADQSWVPGLVDRPRTISWTWPFPGTKFFLVLVNSSTLRNSVAPLFLRDRHTVWATSAPRRLVGATPTNLASACQCRGCGR
jgi:hypothetical protein